MSYATFYFDRDVQTDENTLAYYITEVKNGNATLTATTGGGHDIPAYTAVVLINGNQDATAKLTITSGLASVVTKKVNLLKGTLTSMTLDLSDETNNYSLGRKDGRIGFYKFLNGNKTSITLGANKAYLEVPASNGVKGFTLSLDDADAIRDLQMVNGQMVNGQWPSIYSLSGQRLSRPMKGVNIIAGKKVVVK